MSHLHPTDQNDEASALLRSDNPWDWMLAMFLGGDVSSANLPPMPPARPTRKGTRIKSPAASEPRRLALGFDNELWPSSAGDPGPPAGS